MLFWFSFALLVCLAFLLSAFIMSYTSGILLE
jgi:hypothetical protein